MKREVWRVKLQSQNIVCAAEDEQKADFAAWKQSKAIYWVVKTEFHL